MNLLIVSHEYPPIGGGGANACRFLSRELVRKGHRATVVTASYQNLPPEEEQDGVRIIRVKALRKYRDKSSMTEMLTYLASAYRCARKLAKRQKFDVCQVYFGIPSGPIAYMLKKRYNIPYIVRFGGGDIPGAQKRFAAVYKLLSPFVYKIWKNADYLVANSEGLKRRAEAFSEDFPIQIISNGVDFAFFHKDVRLAGVYPAGSCLQRLPKDTVRILFVSRILEGKGLQDVIPHMRRIEEAAKKRVHFIIVGDGPYRETAQRLAKEAEVPDLVSFEGRREKEEILLYHNNAELFILPSHSEGMPNVVLEAMASGLPIVMTPCEGSKELIQGNGVVAPTEQFIDAVIRMITDEKMRAEMGRRSAEIVKEQFQWEYAAGQYEKLYKKCGQTGSGDEK